MTDRKPVCDLIKQRDSAGNIRWCCSECGALHRDTPRTHYSRNCPVCDRPIIEWLESERPR